LLFSPASRAVGAVVVGIFLVIHWLWKYEDYPYLSRADVSRYNNPAELYCGIFLIVFGLGACALSIGCAFVALKFKTGHCNFPKRPLRVELGQYRAFHRNG
jgi:hypothetical protein